MLEADMGSALPDIPRQVFESGLERVSPVPLATVTRERLYLHYRELRRWNPRLSLVGPGTAAQVLERHYGESLAALPLIEGVAGRLVDLGSGAGFPGFVLAAARSDLDVTLVEARERKWAFLMSACRAAALPCRCLNAKFAPELPAGFPERVELVTARAVKLTRRDLGVLLPRLAPPAVLLFWTAADTLELPSPLTVRRSVLLAGSERRRICVVAAAAANAPER